MKKKILLVDDDPNIVFMTKGRLEANGYDVITAANGNDGLKKALEEQPSLIILDVKMPQMDGWTFVNTIKQSQKGKHIPIVMMTAQGKMREMFEQQGVAAYITKPFKPEELLATVETHIAE